MKKKPEKSARELNRELVKRERRVLRGRVGPVQVPVSKVRGPKYMVLRIKNVTPPMYVCELRGVVFVTFTTELERAARFDPQWRKTVQSVAGVPLLLVPIR